MMGIGEGRLVNKQTIAALKIMKAEFRSDSITSVSRQLLGERAVVNLHHYKPTRVRWPVLATITF